MGIPHVSETIASKIAHDVECDILKILSNAMQIGLTSHSSRLGASHINAALESNFLEPLYGYPEGKSLNLLRVGTVDAVDLFIYEDRQLPVEANARLDLIYPIDLTYDFEWLFVVGRAPSRSEEEDQMEQLFVEKVEPKVAAVQRQRMDSEIVGSSSKHIFSYELQLYNHTSRKHLESGDLRKREAMLADLKREHCLETLFPYYNQFCFSIIRNYPNQCEKLYVAVAVSRALAQNEGLSVDIYLDKLISLAETMLLSAKVGAKTLPEGFLLRDYAADLLRVLMDKSVANYPNVEPVVVSELISVIRDPTTTVPQKYGALVGVIATGLSPVSGFLLKILPPLVADLGGEAEVQVRALARNREMETRLYDAAVLAAGVCLHSDTYLMTATGRFSYSPRAMANYREVADAFGADLLPYFVGDAALLSI
jgi:hypothetical protein